MTTRERTCEECDCADPTALYRLADECDCRCHKSIKPRIVAECWTVAEAFEAMYEALRVCIASGDLEAEHASSNGWNAALRARAALVLANKVTKPGPAHAITCFPELVEAARHAYFLIERVGRQAQTPPCWSIEERDESRSQLRSVLARIDGEKNK